MHRRTIALIGAVLLGGALLLGSVGLALAQTPWGGGWGPGMMHGWRPGSGWGPGGMMWGWGPWGTPGQQVQTLDQARQRVQAYLEALANPDLTIEEVLEFQNQFYVVVKEKSTGLGAFELLVSRAGAVFPEPGPNMMWNTKYGMMARSSPMAGMMGYQPPAGTPSVTAEQARQIAQQWLDRYQPGSTVEAPHTFYGYYTLHTTKDGQITGMLSVNAYTGQVWYHVWHGPFVAASEAEQ